MVLQPPVALVQIDQSFFNPHGRQEEGTFVFNLPPGASVSRFAMYVTHTELIEGELIERQRADEIYTSIVRRRRDPAILEQIGDSLFRMREAVAAAFADEIGDSMTGFALRFPLYSAATASVVVGLNTVKQVEDAVRLVGRVRPDPEIVSRAFKLWQTQIRLPAWP